MLWELGLAGVVFRSLGPLREDAAAGSADDRSSVFLNVSPGAAVSFGLALAAAVVDWQRDGAEVRGLLEKRQVQRAVNAIRQTLRISNDESDAMLGTMLGAGQMLDGDALPTVAQMKRFLATATAGSAIELLRAIARVGPLAQRVEQLMVELARLRATEVAPLPLLTGDDLTAAGFNPGPIFKRVLSAVYDAQLEDRVTTKEQAMEMAREMFAEAKS